MIFIGDVAGQYDCLMRLVAKLPAGREILLLGDLCDRGPKSYQVIEWAKTTKGVDSLYGNHEDLFIDTVSQTSHYEHGLWMQVNGGAPTIVSYADAFPDEEDMQRKLKAHITWLTQRPLFREGDGWIATHAPINPSIAFEDFLDFRNPIREALEDNVIWNRGKIRRRDKYQIYGHNAKINLHKDEEGEFGACIDSSREKCLTAFLWPEKTFIQEAF